MTKVWQFLYCSAKSIKEQCQNVIIWLDRLNLGRGSNYIFLHVHSAYIFAKSWSSCTKINTQMYMHFQKYPEYVFLNANYASTWSDFKLLQLTYIVRGIFSKIYFFKWRFQSDFRDLEKCLTTKFCIVSLAWKCDETNFKLLLRKYWCWKPLFTVFVHDLMNENCKKWFSPRKPLTT